MRRSNAPAILAHPDREAAAALPALEDLFRAAARRVRTRLVNRAGADIPVRLGVAQVTTVGQILDDGETRDGGVFGTFRFKPMGLPGLVVVQGRLLSRVVGIMLGESVDDEPPPYRMRPVTELETRVARRVCDDVMSGLTEAWPSEKVTTVEVESLGPNARLVGGLSASMPVVAASLDFGRPDDPYGLLIVAIPAQAARDLKAPEIDQVSKEVRQRRHNMDRVMPLNLEVRAELARATLPFNEVQGLQQGSLIDLGSPREVKVYVNGRHLMYGQPGESKGVHAVQITRPAPKDPLAE